MQLSLFNFTQGTWEESKGYLWEDLNHIQVAINQFLGQAFNGTTVKTTALGVGGDQTIVPQYIANTGPADAMQWDAVDLVSGVKNRLQFVHFVQASAASRLLGRGSAAGAGDFQEITVGSGIAFSGTSIIVSTITETQISLSDVTTDNVTSTKHGFAPKSPGDPTQYLNGDVTPTWAFVRDSHLLLTDITTNNVTGGQHGFAPRSPSDATKFLNGAVTPAFAQVKDSDLSTSDVTTNDVSSTKHGFAPKSPADSTQFLNGAATPAYASPFTAWVAVTYNSGDFTASGSMTWTVEAGDVTTFAYQMLGSGSMLISFALTTTTVGGTPSTSLKIKIPNSKTSIHQHTSAALVYSEDGGTTTKNGILTVLASSTTISLIKDFGGSTWANSTNNTICVGQIFLDVS